MYVCRIKQYFLKESLSLVQSKLSQSCKESLLEFICISATGTEINKVPFLLSIHYHKNLNKQVFSL